MYGTFLSTFSSLCWDLPGLNLCWSYACSHSLHGFICASVLLCLMLFPWKHSWPLALTESAFCFCFFCIGLSLEGRGLIKTECSKVSYARHIIHSWVSALTTISTVRSLRTWQQYVGGVILLLCSFSNIRSSKFPPRAHDLAISRSLPPLMVSDRGSISWNRP